MSLLVGLAGQIACGKSTVAKVFARCGAKVISGDQLGRETVAPGSPALARLVRAFGASIVDSQGRLRRATLGRIAFSDPEKTAKLNAIVHPELLRRLRQRIAAARKLSRVRLIVVDAALIFDWKLDNELDLVIVVDSPRAQQLARLAAKGMTADEARARLRRQLSKSALRAKADVVLTNSGTHAELVRKSLRLLKQLQKIAARKSS